jgi:hypothetical protein
MITAMIYPEKGRCQTPIQSEFGSDYLRMARTVLSVLPELAAEVRAKLTPLTVTVLRHVLRYVCRPSRPTRPSH